MRLECSDRVCGSYVLHSIQSSNVAQQAEYGVFGMKTPGEVAESRRGEEIDLEDEIAKGRNSILDDRMRQAEGRDGHGRNDKGLEPER